MPHVPVHEAKALSPPFADFVEMDERADLPEFPLDALPRWVSEWALAAADAEQVPLDHALTLGLAALSTAVMGKAKVSIWGEPLNLYLLLIDRSGANKSGIFKAAMGPIEAYVARVERDAGAEIAVWQASRDAAEQALKSATSKRANAGKKTLPTEAIVDRELAQEDLEAAAKELHRLEASRPQGGLRFCGDLTPETIDLLLSQNHAVAIHSAEGAEVFEGLGRYQKSAEKMEALLKPWKGDTLRVDRKSGLHIVKVDPVAGIVAMAQPAVLGALRDPTGKREGRGLLGRFLYNVPRSLVGKRTPTRGAMDAKTLAAYRGGLERLASIPFPAHVDGQSAPPLIPVSEDAWTIFEAFYAEIERELRPAGDLVDVESFASKIRSALARIAGILHLANGAGFDDSIDVRTMNHALAITRYFLAHGKVAHGMMDADSGAALALRLFAKIAELVAEAAPGQAHPIVKTRDVVFAAKGAKAFKTAKAMGAVLDTLEAAGYVLRVKPDDGERGERLGVNPDALKVWNRRRTG